MTELHRDSFRAGQYFLGVAGMATMREILRRPATGLPRMAEMREIVENRESFPNDLVIEVVEHDVASGYTAWAPIYDGPNPAIELEAPVVQRMIDDIGGGDGERALDAACGTGRHAGYLHGAGFSTVGVDATPAMLDVARSSHPDIEFLEGRLEELPVDDASCAIVTSALAVCHAPDLEPVFREFARVLQPGGTLIVSDPHPASTMFGGAAAFRDRDADPSAGLTIPFVRNLHHPIHTYVNAAVGAGLEIVECHEPVHGPETYGSNPAYAVLPDAVEQAYAGLPFLVIWRMRKPG